ncbi:MAG: class I SAM-dependent methyltransferase, partial [Clostridia bacterium]|nr:class I SAM-dependent methyltransferase [Clostridia bacterium]
RGGSSSEYGEIINLINEHMTDDEKRIYNYYVGKGDAAKAGEYLDYMTDVLRQRAGGRISDQVDDTVWETLTSFVAGTESGIKGIGHFVSGVVGGKEDLGPSALQYAHGTSSENNKGAWKVTNDLLYTTGNMTPSLTAGAFATAIGGPGAGKIVGSAVTGLSSSGNAYAQMIEKGYGADQARKYGILTGSAEAGLSYLISGISKLGGKLTGKAIEKAIEKIDSGIARFFVDFTINSASEAVEGGAQSVLEPLFKMLATGENFEGVDWSEVAYSSLLGSLSAGLLEGVPNGVRDIHQNYRTSVDAGGLSITGATGAFFKGYEGSKGFKGVSNAYREGQQNVNESAGYLSNEGLMIDPENAQAKRMQARLSKGKNVSGYQINRMIEANEGTLVSQDKTKIKAAVEKRLTELGGETGNVANIADVIVKKVAGERLTRAEQSMLKKDFTAKTALFELSENFLNNEYYREDADSERYWAEHIGTERINADLYSRMLAEMGEDDADQTAETPVVENSEETVNPIEETSEGFVDQTADEADIDEEPEEVLTLEEAKTKYGSQAEAFLRTYTEGQNVKQYDRAYQMAYDMGKSGVSFPYVMKSSATTYLTEKQRQLAYEAGQSAAAAIASERYAGIKAAANGKKGRKKGTVKGENVTIADLKTTFNDTQNTAYKILCTFAEATGIDIVLYQSEANENGKFEEAQGKFSRKTDKIRIDINAGLTNVKDVKDLAKYTMLRTFSHEFTHFLEKWNPEWYNEFRKTVFDTITSRGEDVTDLIEKKQDQSQVHYYDEKIGDFVTDEMTYDDASREVIAEAMTDILPDSQFIETLVNKHKNIFEKLYEMLKEFLADLKAYFKTIVRNPSREAKALKEQIDGAVRYVENIVRMFDEGAAGAVENYQMTVAFDEDTVIVEENPATNEDIPDTEEVIPDTHEDNPLGLTDEEQSAIMAYQETLSANHGGQQTKSSESDQTEVQRLSEQNSRDAEMQPVSERDSEGDTEKSESVHGVHKEVSTSSGELIIKPKETVSKQGEPSIEEREKSFKRKFAFLKKAGQVGVLHYGNVSLLTDSSLAIMATADEINFAHIEYSGTVTERDTKGTPLEKTIDHANTQITEAPLQGVSDGMDVLVFNVDGKHAVFNKKLFSKLDGNILYIGDFGKGGYILKVVDLDGNVAGFLLSMKIKGEITDAEPSKLKSFSKKFLEQIKKQEEKTDVTENVDHQGTVLQPDSDRQGDSRVLEEFQAEDVSGNAQRGDVVGDSVERGQETRRDGDRADLGAGSRSESGDGDRQSGDLRRDDDVTPKEATEKLREEVTAQIEQQSTETPKGKNFVIGDSLDLPKGDKAKCSANIDAIKLLKKLEAEGRYATEAEQIILSKYVGWGGLSNAFDESKDDWRKEYNELKGILTDEEYRAARVSTRSAFFTDISVVKAMYDGLAKLGFRGGRMIEPSAGTGNFVGAMPAEMSANVKSWTMIELDNITGLISKYLYPNADVRIQGFEKANIPNNYMDVAIGNVPFGNDAIYDKAYPKKVTSAIHNYFFAKSLDKVRPGGIVMFITSSYTMDSKDETVRRYIMQKADLLGAIRLPNTAFKTNAGTDVVSDILILKKRAAGTSYAGEDFLSSPWDYPVKNHYSGAYVNSYFNAHPEMILGTPSMVSGRFGGNTLTYKAIEGKGSLADQIREAFSHIDGKMDYPAKLSPEKTNFAVERADKKTKQNGYVAKDGK